MYLNSAHLIPRARAFGGGQAARSRGPKGLGIKVGAETRATPARETRATPARETEYPTRQQHESRVQPRAHARGGQPLVNFEFHTLQSFKARASKRPPRHPPKTSSQGYPKTPKTPQTSSQDALDTQGALRRRGGVDWPSLDGMLLAAGKPPALHRFLLAATQPLQTIR